jgi:hypothetical protein
MPRHPAIPHGLDGLPIEQPRAGVEGNTIAELAPVAPPPVAARGPSVPREIRAVVPEPGKIVIRDKDGSFSKIPVEQLAQAESEGARVATKQDLVAREWSPGWAAAAGVASAIPGYDTATLAATRALKGDQAAEEMRELTNMIREARPTEHALGELAGVGLLTAATGGLGGGAAAAEGGAMAAARAAAPRLAAEGAALGATNTLREDTLESYAGNPKLRAEDYLAGAAVNGAIGVLVGAPLVAGGHVASKAAGSLGKFFGRGAAREIDAVAEEVSASARATEDALDLSRPRHTVEHGADFSAGVGSAPRATVEPFAGDGPMLMGVDPAAQAEAPTFFGRGRHRVTVDPDEGMMGSFAHAREEGLPRVMQPGKLPRGGDGDAPVFFRQRGSGVDAPESVTFRMQEFGEDVGLAQERAVSGPGQIGMGRQVTFNPDLHPIGEEEIVEPFVWGITEDPAWTKAAQAQVKNAKAGIAAAEEARIANLPSLERESYLHHTKATGAGAGDFQKLGRTYEQQKLAAAAMGETVAKRTGAGAFTSVAEYSAAVSREKEVVGKELGSLYGQLDGLAKHKPSVTRIVEEYQATVKAPAMQRVLGAEETGAADSMLERFVGMRDGSERASFTKLHEFMQEIDTKLLKTYSAPKGMPIPPGQEGLLALRKLVRDELDFAAMRASAEATTDLGERILSQNRLYKQLATADRILARQSGRELGSSFVSQGDLVAMAAGTFSGSPFGLLIPVANQVRKRYGDQIAAAILKKASTLRPVQNAADKMEQAMRKGVAAVSGGKHAPKPRPQARVTGEDVDKIRAAVSSPDAVEARVRTTIGDLHRYEPQTAGAIAMTLARTAAYLNAVLPKKPAPPSPFSRSPQRPYSDSDLRKATAIVETVQDPTIVLDRLREGKLTAEHVKTLKATSPENYVRVREFLMEHAPEIRKTTTVQQEVQLSILFGTPLTPAMEPKAIRALQASFVGGNQAPSPGAAAGFAPSVAQMAAGPVKGGGHRETYFDALAKGGRK